MTSPVDDFLYIYNSHLRCYTTADRSALKSIGDFDAIVMNQRSIRWFDMPKQSRGKHD